MNKQQIQAKILDKISVATVWGKEGTQLYIGNIIYETIEETEKEIQVLIDNAVKENQDIFIKNLDKAIFQCHGGGNGKRLLLQIKEELK